MRQLVSITDPTLFFIDPTLHLVAHLYSMGCFGDKGIDEIFGRDVLVFPLEECTVDLPIFRAADGMKPASENNMNARFKKYALAAGFPSHVTSYSMRSGVARDLLSKGVSDETVKKLLH